MVKGHIISGRAISKTPPPAGWLRTYGHGLQATVFGPGPEALQQEVAHELTALMLSAGACVAPEEAQAQAAARPPRCTQVLGSSPMRRAATSAMDVADHHGLNNQLLMQQAQAAQQQQLGSLPCMQQHPFL